MRFAQRFLSAGAVLFMALFAHAQEEGAGECRDLYTACILFGGSYYHRWGCGHRS